MLLICEIKKKAVTLLSFIVKDFCWGRLLGVGKDFCCGRLNERMTLKREKKGIIHIIAGGPSFIKSQNLVKKISGDVMMVNYIFTSEFAKKYPPQYWVSADPAFDEDEKFLTSLRKYAKKHHDFAVIFPSYLKKLKKLKIQQYRINTKMGGSIETDKWDIFFYKHNFYSPIFQNSATFALYAAIQMGYKKIYLHGCELDVTFLGDKNNNVIIPQYIHSYEIKDSEKTKISPNLCYVFTEEELNEPHMYKMLRTMTLAYEGLHQVAAYAKSLGVKIYNMSETSVVDEFEKWKYDE